MENCHCVMPSHCDISTNILSSFLVDVFPIKSEMSKHMYHKWFFDHTHLKMAWIHHQIQPKDGYLSYPPPVFPSYPSPYPDSFHNESMSSSSLSPPPASSRISPAVLFIIVILAVLFFISGLLHLLVRFLIRPSTHSNRHHQDISTSDALQRQLQQLFHLHDSGLDQAFIDALPVFQYKEIVGLKEPFDCAVCLCEFTEKDKLRLLPTCSHAFHISCIDTWLLSNSTCPLCRGTLFAPGFSFENPMFDVDDVRENGCPYNEENGFSITRQKTVEIEEDIEKGILPVRLGKFRKLNVEEEGENAGGETSSRNLDARRCFSMGSYQYVLGNSDLRITLNHDSTNLTEGTEHNDNITLEGDKEGKRITSVSKGESYSVSKIWLWSNKGKFSSSSDAQMDMPSSLDTDLPWMRKTREGT
ncbi:RING-H2 finger protein ATL46-like [Senna tora]|uniref:RING-type E3 ubiquitin transferase n=1 Tax=Senna tora TaxID=362788 RepID=A0A834SFJ0_9FABA|nr:RING-H2 finger protein ATL46-like [Senna tora]